jgi:flagellin
MQADWPDVIIEATSASSITIKSDELADRKAGSGSRIGFSAITVSNEPLPTIDFLSIDVAANPEQLDRYITYMETATARVIDGAATLGALQKRIEMQTEFAAKLLAGIDAGIGRLVDADMNEESTRLKALETQRQLAIQTLAIANGSTDGLVQLFR